MNFYESFINDRCEGESISSWMFRLQCNARRYPCVSDGDVFRTMTASLSRPDRMSPVPSSKPEDKSTETHSARMISTVANPVDDFDQGLTPAMAQAFVQRNYIPASLLTPFCAEKPFEKLYGHARHPKGVPWVGTVIIPLQHRCSYCYQCVEEGIRATGLPVIKSCWRHVLMPFCSKHEALLYDVSGRISLNEDFPAAVFKFHWSRTFATTRFDEHTRSDISRLKGAMRVQQRVIDLWEGTTDVVQRSANLGFVLTLFRMVLQPTYEWAYSKKDMFNVGGPPSGLGFYSAFYNLPLRATAFARARALFLVGLILGWIDQDEAQAPEFWDGFAPQRAHTIWAHLPYHGPLRSWVRRELDLYNAGNFSRQSLRDTPYGW